MAVKTLTSYLKLSYTPISNYDFAAIKSNDVLQSYLNNGHIYIIAQRPVITFNNLTLDKSNYNPILEFTINQIGSAEVLNCKFPICQENLCAQNDPLIGLYLTYIHPKPDPIPIEGPYNGLANFVLTGSNGDKFWFSPEKLFYHYWNGHIQLVFKGDIDHFTHYKIHYIGKATEQDIVKRLTGHSHLQDILSLELPFHYGSLPTNEIVLLLFNFEDTIHANSYAYEEPVEDTVELIMGRSIIPEKTIYTDAEKALINSLKPKHNRQYYPKYPLSADGISSFKLDGYSYCFVDPITLIYSDGTVKGHKKPHLADYIWIEGNKRPVIIKGQESKKMFGLK